VPLLTDLDVLRISTEYRTLGRRDRFGNLLRHQSELGFSSAESRSASR
jgi:hypothetical protein